MRRSYQQQRRYADSLTKSQADVQLTLLLNGCSDHALQAMTAEYLSRTHKVPLAVCEVKLRQARQDRFHD